ncbi:hypothetical protein [Oceanobacillus kapialis]|uniref:Uncharacterized protein n=1 Tax=Oceanobacillus kapialis TaxID=481353 RepID=A0ABW5PVN6_9BACI
MDHYLTIEKFNKLLTKWNGRTVRVSKQEIDDYDETIMNLEAVSYESNPHRLDEYTPLYSLQLNGTGQVENSAHNMEELPSAVYEIPLEDSSLYQFDGSRFSLTTDRGIYTIELMD